MTDSPFRARVEVCQDALDEGDADAIVLFPSRNMYYLSGFEDEPMERHLLLFVAASSARFVVPELYGHEIDEASHVDRISTWADGEDPLEVIEQVTDDLGLTGGHVLVDDTMWARFTQDLESALPDATFGLASEVLADLRITKDDRERDALRNAATRADAVSERVRSLGADAVGNTERELAQRIDGWLVEEGCDGPAFETIVGSGPNGAKPHHRHGDRTIESGDPVVLDFGGWYEHYPGDQTRTVVFDGDPPTGFEDAHTAVREALETGVAAVEPGVTAGSVDRSVRDVIERHGFGDEFVHRTGHGVGLDVHEPPYVVGGNDRELEPGMVFSVEPGVYVEEEFGVRVEDLVAVTEDGCERLNDSPRTWRPL